MRFLSISCMASIPAEGVVQGGKRRIVEKAETHVPLVSKENMIYG